MEGTDEVIRRAGRIAGAGRRGGEGGEAAPGPALRRAGGGPGHARGDARGGRRVLAVDAGQTLLIDKAALPGRGRRGRASRSGASSGRAEPVTTRVGVVGVGALGQHHARVYAALPRRDARGRLRRGAGARARGRGSATAARSSRTCATWWTRSDAVSVAVPTVDHHRVVARAARRGQGRARREADRGHARRGRRPDRALAARARGASCRWATSSASTRRSTCCGPTLEQPRFIEVHRLGSFSPAQPRHRRRAGPHDPRPRHRPGPRRLGGGPGRRRRRARS